MNYYFKYSIILLLCTGLFCCGDDGNNPDPELNRQQQAAQSLSQGSPWQVIEVIDQPNEYLDVADLLNLQLSFGITGTGASLAPATFSASGADQFIMAPSGAQWSWSGSGISTIELTNVSTSQFTNLQLSPSPENINQVTLTFSISGTGGRLMDISGQYSIKLE
ncbi:MAG: hypothetical protein ACNS62_06940 [Candidatus Cyclobacteriaceae bacterium M3_2C_046]